MRRHCPVWVVALAAALHALGMARSPLPAQDGLKFIRVAREFQTRPFADVVRDSDQHPLYPLAIALTEPAVRLFVGPGPDAWRIAAQLASAAASLCALLLVYHLTLCLFDRTAATLAAVLFAILPGLVEVGHDTLSDPLALALFLAALLGAVRFLQVGSIAAAAGFGLAAGLGYWTRPEAALLPVALASLLIARCLLPVALRGRACVSCAHDLPGTLRAAAPGLLGFLVVVGAYALLKGEVSEKLALRRTAAIASVHDAPRRTGPAMPPGLADPRWDFSPKEESRAPAQARSAPVALAEIANLWAGSLGWVFAALAVVGIVRVRCGPGWPLVTTYALVFIALLVRHVGNLGYLSDRHVLTLTAASMPWAAAGAMDSARRFARRLGWHEAHRARRRAVVVALLLILGLALHLRPAHASRSGHLAAGQWLARHCTPDQAVFDTRGWAAFLAHRPSYDAWHIRQALTDRHLAYCVVGQDELDADSPRARTLRAILAYAARPVASFPGRDDGSGIPVRIYRFLHPGSWEGLHP